MEECTTEIVLVVTKVRREKMGEKKMVRCMLLNFTLLLPMLYREGFDIRPGCV